jgi:hypothetical protein
VHLKNILIYVQQYATLHSLFYLEIALHISGGTTAHYQERKQLYYSIWYLSHRYCYLPLSWKSWNCSAVVCASDDGWWYHPKHVEQFPDKINGVTLHLVGHILEDSCLLIAQIKVHNLPHIYVSLSQWRTWITWYIITSCFYRRILCPFSRNG